MRALLCAAAIAASMLVFSRAAPAQRRRDLDKARAGKAGKIAGREAKLAREQAELERLLSGTR